MSPRPRLLMCPPTHFGVAYVINPWMQGNIGRVDRARAQSQWDRLLAVLRNLAEVDLIDPGPGLPDMCFVANAGLVCNNEVVLSRFRHVEREGERPHARRWFAAHGFEVRELTNSASFEGEGDALFQPGEPLLWSGYGVRSSLQVYRSIADWFGADIKPLRLVDERFYHLDTCFTPLPNGRAMFYSAAFDHESLDQLREYFPESRRIEVSADDALGFACNAIPLGKVIVLPHASPALQDRLREWDYATEVCPLDEFLRAGGAAKCLVLRLDHHVEARRAAASTIAERVVTLDGQLLDTDLLNTALDAITDLGGSFEFDQFMPGLRHDEKSSARVRVSAPNDERMEAILAALLKFGAAHEEQPREATLVEVEQEAVAPKNFYSTTIYPTDVLIHGRWVRAQKQRMDSIFVVDDVAKTPKISCRLIRDLKRGDHVVCGSDGVRVHVPRDGAARADSFSFMGGAVSSERRVEVTIDRVAWEMQRIRDQRGKIAVVAGPVVVHTGGAPYLAELINRGYVHALLGGNAIAAHDIEYNVLGTSLGVDLRRGVSVPGGHRHHLHVINEVRRAGSIHAAVEQGFITGGIMHACVKKNVPFCLAGSIRDDGPLPETLMDLFEAQRRYTELIDGADMILMLSSMLHAIATGNMTPAGVRLICVDINPAVVTKLADRGSLESIGVVTDVGLFLNLLVRRLKDLQPKPTPTP